jgi:hypothetical protein
VTDLFAPVVVFAYNRPEHLRQTLATLAKADGASQTPLWIFCDGPKNGKDPAPNFDVQEIARDPAWPGAFASVHVVTSAVNKGLARSIIEGVSNVIEKAGRAIVIEDDLIVSSGFLRFMNEALDFYGEDSTIGSVTGFCPLATPPCGYAHDVMRVPRNCSHGWGTWADRWVQVDWTATGARQLRRDPALRRRLNSAGSDRLDRLRRQLLGRIDSWSIRFGLWQVLAGVDTIYPVRNHVRNEGFDGSGVHTRAGDEINATLADAGWNWTLTSVSRSEDVSKAFRAVYSGPLHKRLVRWARTRPWVWGLQ